MTSTSGSLRIQRSCQPPLQGSVKQPGIIVVFFIFIAGVSLVVAQSQRSTNRLLSARLISKSSSAFGEDAGSLRLLADLAQSKVCLEVVLQNGTKISSVRLHSASGPQAQEVISLQPASTNSGRDCFAVEKSKLLDIATNPTDYFVDVTREGSEPLQGQLTN
jgi:hypothetical protein